jgi:hypothetical protein
VGNKTIKDIRLYKSGLRNEFGDPVTTSFADKKLNAITQRVVMKLRENEFSLGEFDHLYINFIPSDMGGKMYLSDDVDRYHSWYRNCYVPVDVELYSNLRSADAYDAIIHWISTVLVTYFSPDDFDQAHILDCVQQAVDQGEDMRVKFKEKISAKRKAFLYLRFLDTCRFYLLLRVYDAEDRLLFEKDLPETVSLDALGEIQVSAKRVTIKPRKNAFTKQTNPLIFEYE